MADDERGRAVPSGRLSRFGRFGRMAGGARRRYRLFETFVLSKLL